MRILVIRVDHLGDLVLTTPLFRALGRAGHEVHVVARKSALPVLSDNPFLRRTTALEDVAPGFPGRGVLRLAAWIRSVGPDVVILPHAKPASLVAAARLGHAGRILTMWGGWQARVFMCRNLPSRLLEDPRHISDIWLDLARELGAAPDGFAPDVFVTTEESDAIAARLAPFGEGPWVVVHPGCAGNTCNPQPEFYADVVRRLLSATSLRVAVTGSPKERETLGTAFAGLDCSRVWNAMGQLDLRELCALIAHASAIVCVGTGPLHIASAVGTSSVSPFCRKTGVCAKVWGNLGAESRVIEPPAALCSERPDGTHCDFRGTLSADALVAAIAKIALPS